MEKLFIPGSDLSPEVILDPATWRLSVSGTSAPEDVRSLYYPVTEWVTEMVNKLIDNPAAADKSGVVMTFDLKYFNSSSGKFFHDIFVELARLRNEGCSLEVRWLYDADDQDMLEAGQDMAELSKLEFTYLPK
ncbi:MAG: DUF1987 domain-containing protein [Bacteroidales bacterium]